MSGNYYTDFSNEKKETQKRLAFKCSRKDSNIVLTLFFHSFGFPVSVIRRFNYIKLCPAISLSGGSRGLMECILSFLFILIL
jgi:hypothetical protein